MDYRKILPDTYQYRLYHFKYKSVNEAGQKYAMIAAYMFCKPFWNGKTGVPAGH